ncbi:MULTISPECIES: BRO family protein [unclassified Streptomyces]|uniref:BRO family protein n=1 Tax=unclassified Streptomyces TaxID=2593676 RepID=UPI00278BB72E|nr:MULTISPECIES: BRO family protein [unclassified Streptomyces]
MTMVPSPSTPLVFTFPEIAQHVRSVMIDAEPWWVARDVADVLELGNMHSSLALLDEDEKGVHSLETPGGAQQLAIISEPGLYSLILRSRKPQAKAFKRWITHEVIPSIRRTGSYSVQPREMTKLEALQAAIESEQARIVAEARVAELEPAAHSWNTLASAEGDFAVGDGDAAKILSRDPSIQTGRNRLFGILHELGWAFVQNADHRYRANQYAIERRWLSELPQSHYHPRTGELVLDAPQLRVTVKGLNELHKRLGGSAQLQLPSLPTQGGAR